MSEGESWAWLALFLLGAYHGINPGMGWLFAVALGMQEKSGAAVWRALPPMAVGHLVAIAAVVALAGLVQFVVPLKTLKVGIALVLFALGLYRLLRTRHPRWGGMQVSLVDLAIWSFLMASFHGAGLMVLPVLFGLPAPSAHPSAHVSAMPAFASPAKSLVAVAVHTAGYLLVTGVVAWVVYAKLGVALLRKAWVNLDLIWAAALLATSFFVLLV
jgi:hypothetical protein